MVEEEEEEVVAVCATSRSLVEERQWWGGDEPDESSDINVFPRARTPRRVPPKIPKSTRNKGLPLSLSPF